MIRGDWKTQDVLSVDELAEVLHVGRRLAYEAVSRGEVPSRRVGRRIVIPVPALRTWLGEASANGSTYQEGEQGADET